MKASSASVGSHRSLVFLVNGDPQSAAAFRARGLTAHLTSEYQISIGYRTGNKRRAILRFLHFLYRTKPNATYVIDMAYSGVLAGLLYKLFWRNRLIIDTGDAIYALARSMGRNTAGACLTWLLEWSALRFADQLIVRGSAHKEMLYRKGLHAEVIHDGIETTLFQPMDVTDLRQRYELMDYLTVGVVGSITWNPRLQMCYGLEIIEALRLLNDLPVKGVVIGDGSGLDWLKARAREYGLTDRVLFFGRIPYSELPRYVNLIDICVSTQTNDVVGRVRTTGKLPIYLATGRYILATRVGEAALVLPDNMLVEYRDCKDREYPKRLAWRVRDILDNRDQLRDAELTRLLAVRHFDYTQLAQRLSTVLASQIA
jgi:glycosyltransferase involved in cell wall biosynthesis